MNTNAGNRRPPHVEELVPAPDPWTTCQALRDLPSCVFFDSALHREHLGRYSFLTADPVETFVLTDAEMGTDPFAAARSVWEQHRCEHVEDLPPFQGGLAGLLSYELGRCWERIPPASANEFQIPLMAVGLYDWTIAWDHREHRAWLITHDLGRQSAQQRAEMIRTLLSAPSQERTQYIPPARRELENQKSIEDRSLPALSSNFRRDEYLQAVEQVIEYIRAGDIFQANLAQRLLHPLNVSPEQLYARLRQENPATFAAYFRWDDWSVMSASPERFLALRGDEVETRPIKGTRRRGDSPEAELFTRDELRQSEKDIAENVMIVDLLRNDLSRVCLPGTVHAPQLCLVETYETVQHLVSEIRGTLRPEVTPFDLLAATFPGGSITGAPKVRAMEVIAELDPTVRGPYCGSLFYLGFDGWMDSSILIRTFTARHGWLQCPVGGGIVVQSDPLAEYHETLHKASGMLKALRSEQGTRS